MNIWHKILNSKTIKQTVSGIIMMAAGILGIIFVLWLTGNLGKEGNGPGSSTATTTIIIATTTSVSLYPEFDSLSMMKKTPPILFNTLSYTPSDDVQTYSFPTKLLKPVGEFSKLYLYVEASFNEGKLTGGQDLYLKFNDFGGHIKNKPFSVPENAISRLLYDIDNIQYVEKLRNYRIEAVSWFDLFNDVARSDKNIKMDGFISSQKEAWIVKMELYYQCSRGIECSIIEIK